MFALGTKAAVEAMRATVIVLVNCGREGGGVSKKGFRTLKVRRFVVKSFSMNEARGQ